MFVNTKKLTFEQREAYKHISNNMVSNSVINSYHNNTRPSFNEFII